MPSVEVTASQLKVVDGDRAAVVVLKDPAEAAAHAEALEMAFAAGETDDLVRADLLGQTPEPDPPPAVPDPPAADQDEDEAEVEVAAEYRPETTRFVITVDTPEEMVLWCRLGDQTKTPVCKPGKSTRSYKVAGDAEVVIRGGDENGPTYWTGPASDATP